MIAVRHRRGVLLAAPLCAFALVLLAVVSHWSPVHRLDVRVADSLNRIARDHPGQTDWWRDVSRVLHPEVLRVVAALAALALFVRHRRRAAVLVVVAMAGEAGLESAGKAIVDRARPSFAHPVATASGAAFPSGHAMTSLVAFGLLVLLVPARLRAVASAVAAVAVGLVGYSRLALGVHYLTDVVGGWLLGGVCLAAADWIVAGRIVSRLPREGGPPGRDRPRGTPAC